MCVLALAVCPITFAANQMYDASGRDINVIRNIIKEVRTLSLSRAQESLFCPTTFFDVDVRRREASVCVCPYMN